MLEPNSQNKQIAFENVCNNFDPKALEGELLQRFYIEAFSQSAVLELKTRIAVTKQYCKLLVVGHRGCGKSTILNKICQDLKNYTVVAYSATHVVNISEIEAIDILLATYLKVLEKTHAIEEQIAEEKREAKQEELKNKAALISAKELEANPTLKKPKGIIPIVPVAPESERVPNFYKMTGVFRELLKKLSIPIDLTETNVSLLGLISFKYRVEPETRANLRFKLKGEVKELQRNIHEACTTLNKLSGKEILIVIDDLDKLTPDVAKNIFFENYPLLSDTPAKVIYAFPLDTYYDPDYNKYSDLYEEIFIPICNLTDISGKYRCLNTRALLRMVYKRIDKKLVNTEALLYLVKMSGGLLRDLVKFMHEACILAIIAKEGQVTLGIAKTVIERKINGLDRVFDALNYKEVIFEMERDRHNISKEHLVYLLHNLFAFEYREGNDVWYIIHPCLKQALTSSK